MKKIELKQLVKEELNKILKEEFYRLPGHVIGNELYSIVNNLKSIYSSLINGDDFNVKEFNQIISGLQKIKKEAKSFNSENEVPVS